MFSTSGFEGGDSGGCFALLVLRFASQRSETHWVLAPGWGGRVTAAGLRCAGLSITQHAGLGGVDAKHGSGQGGSYPQWSQGVRRTRSSASALARVLPLFYFPLSSSTWAATLCSYMS